MSGIYYQVLITLDIPRSYFRQLQEISDTVAEVQWEGSVQSALANNDTECAELDVKINTGRARQRYLDHLASAQADGTLDEEEESCILCKCDFTRGYVTAWCVSDYNYVSVILMSFIQRPCLL